ncbi:hypothetical protein [Micromonospora okii]|uniref:hypothetical protein n=1 Tax=Micromonospora okii TaxID=1182970 RepID=UPI001E60041A|nr:hypothetical protein [Micromonospora okii]
MLVVVSLTAALAGCGTPPELRGPAPRAAATAAGSSVPPPPAAPTAPAAPPAATTPPAAPPTSAGTDLVAVPCRNGPSGDRVIALLRGSRGVLPPSVRVRVRTGPLCAGEWQYTVLRVSGHEELQVVTRGRPGALRLVTAGTDVCTIEVRVTGPTGIRALACDPVPGGVPGA